MPRTSKANLAIQSLTRQYPDRSSFIRSLLVEHSSRKSDENNTAVQALETENNDLKNKLTNTSEKAEQDSIKQQITTKETELADLHTKKPVGNSTTPAAPPWQPLIPG